MRFCRPADGRGNPQMFTSRLHRTHVSLMVILSAAVLFFTIIHYTQKNESDTPTLHKDNYIIYICDGSSECGGWADRFKGIVAAYLIANATNRKFGIHMTLPCDLSTHMLPNLVDWRVDMSKISNDSEVFMAISDAELLVSMKVINFNKLFQHTVTYFAYNLDIVPYFRYNTLYSKNLLWMSGLKNHDVYRLIYKTLFRFSPQLERRLQEFSLNRKMGRSLKCAQIRLGRNPSNLGDTEVRSKYSDVAMIWDFFRNFVFDRNNHHNHDNSHYSYSDSFRIFVTSDSEQVRSDAAVLFPDHIVDLPGRLVHIERSTKSKEDVCAGFSKVLLDQVILASCDTLIISKSGFGEISAYLRGRDTDLYCFRYSKLYKCSMSDFDFDINVIIKIVTLAVFSIGVKVLLCYFFMPVRMKMLIVSKLKKLYLRRPQFFYN